MENRSPFSSSVPTTTTTTTSSSSSFTIPVQSNQMGVSQNSQFFNLETELIPSPFSYNPDQQFNLQQQNLFPYPYPFGQIGQSPIYPEYWVPESIPMGAGVQNPYFSQSQMAIQLDQLQHLQRKIARSNRKLARQRSLSFARNSSSSAGASSTSTVLTLPTPTPSEDADTVAQNPAFTKHLYTFCAPDNKKLRELLRKELKNSDVGSLGRIVLPKREAEENLPHLNNKEGIQIAIRDIYSNQEWSFKYKYWSNNNSRMYVLENTGEFVRKNQLGTGDFITLYDDEEKNLLGLNTCVSQVSRGFSDNYLSVTKGGASLRPLPPRPRTTATGRQINLNATTNNAYNGLYEPTNAAKEEEEASLALLIEQLKNNDSNSLVTLSMDEPCSSCKQR